MIYLILDTNNWIYLANGLDPIKNKYHDSLHFELLQSLIDLTKEGKIKILINDIILNEWNRNKIHCYTKIKSLENKLLNKENAFKDIEKYSTLNIVQLQNDYTKGLENEISKNNEHIQNVENFLLNNCIKTEITKDLKLHIFDLSIKNDPPFHNKKNNVGDAAILFSSINYLKENNLSEEHSIIFISNNIEEYTDGKNLNELHPHLKNIFNPIDIKFERVLPAALNISKKIIAQIEHLNIELAKFAEKQFIWDIDKRENASLMFLDVQYYNKQKEQSDFLTLCVGKEVGSDRPKFLSFILPSYLNQENGIFLYFANNKIDEETNNFKIETDSKSIVRIYFEDINKETCTARIRNGYSTNEESGLIIDVFKKLLESDSIFVMYFNEDLTPQTISIPLFSFRQQYLLIPE